MAYLKVRDNPLHVKQTTWKNYLKNYPWKIKVFERDNYQCVKCGRKPPEYRIHTHHLDKNGSQSKNFNGKENNSLSNLITVCVRCHANIHKVEFKMNPNTGMMREMRNEGLTYQQIGDDFGITRQRVHQLLKGYTNSRGKNILGVFGS